jgi:hypothetical protein
MDDWSESVSTLRRIAAPLAFTNLVSSAAGIALMLRSNVALTKRVVFAALLSSWAAGTIVFLLLYEYLSDKPILLYGVSTLSGAGGASTLDLLFILMRRMAVKRGWLKEKDLRKEE